MDGKAVSIGGLFIGSSNILLGLSQMRRARALLNRRTAIGQGTLQVFAGSAWMVVSGLFLVAH
jgi:hypothetical protein